MPQFTMPAVSIGWFIALILLVVAIVLIVIGRFEMLYGVFFAGLALARLL